MGVLKNKNNYFSYEFYQTIREMCALRDKTDEYTFFHKEIEDLKRCVSRNTRSPILKAEYALRLIYCNLYNYDVSFGKIFCLNLTKEKNILTKKMGYLASAHLLAEDSEKLLLVVGSIQNDLISPNFMEVENALQNIERLLNKDYLSAVIRDLKRLATGSPSIPPSIESKALCALHRCRELEPSSVPEFHNLLLKKLLVLTSSPNQGNTSGTKRSSKHNYSKTSPLSGSEYNDENDEDSEEEDFIVLGEEGSSPFSPGSDTYAASSLLPIMAAISIIHSEMFPQTSERSKVSLLISEWESDDENIEDEDEDYNNNDDDKDISYERKNRSYRRDRNLNYGVLNLYREAVSPILIFLVKIVNRNFHQSFEYHMNPIPWHQSMAIQILSQFAKAAYKSNSGSSSTYTPDHVPDYINTNTYKKSYSEGIEKEGNINIEMGEVKENQTEIQMKNRNILSSSQTSSSPVKYNKSKLIDNPIEGREEEINTLVEALIFFNDDGLKSGKALVLDTMELAFSFPRIDRNLLMKADSFTELLLSSSLNSLRLGAFRLIKEISKVFPLSITQRVRVLVVKALFDSDETIQLEAFRLAKFICNEKFLDFIVHSMLSSMGKVKEKGIGLNSDLGELVFEFIILCEKFAKSKKWFLEKIVEVIGNFVEGLDLPLLNWLIGKIFGYYNSCYKKEEGNKEEIAKMVLEVFVEGFGEDWEKNGSASLAYLFAVLYGNFVSFFSPLYISEDQKESKDSLLFSNLEENDKENVNNSSKDKELNKRCENLLNQIIEFKRLYIKNDIVDYFVLEEALKIAKKNSLLIYNTNTNNDNNSSLDLKLDFQLNFVDKFIPKEEILYEPNFSFSDAETELGIDVEMNDEMDKEIGKQKKEKKSKHKNRTKFAFYDETDNKDLRFEAYEVDDIIQEIESSPYPSSHNFGSNSTSPFASAESEIENKFMKGPLDINLVEESYLQRGEKSNSSLKTVDAISATINASMGVENPLESRKEKDIVGESKEVKNLEEFVQGASEKLEDLGAFETNKSSKWKSKIESKKEEKRMAEERRKMFERTKNQSKKMVSDIGLKDLRNINKFDSKNAMKSEKEKRREELEKKFASLSTMGVGTMKGTFDSFGKKDDKI